MSTSPFQRFLGELRRRHVPQTAAIYLVAAWAVIEFSDVVVPNLNGPQWVVTAVIVAAGVGFPVMLVLAWMFDWGPEGVQRTGPDGEASRTGAPTGGRAPGTPTPWLAVIAVLVVGIGSAIAVAALLDGNGPAGGAVEEPGRTGVEAPAPRTPAMVPFDSLSRRVLDELEVRGLEGLGDLGELEALGSALDSAGQERLEAMAGRLAGRADSSVVIERPRNWRLGPGVPATLEAGDTLVVEGVARDSVGVVTVTVDGDVVAESAEPRPTLPFSARLVGTTGRGLRTVPVVVRTGDGREVVVEFFIVFAPETP